MSTAPGTVAHIARTRTARRMEQRDGHTLGFRGFFRIAIESSAAAPKICRHMVRYTGHMKVTATEFKAKCLGLIDRVSSNGEAVTITKRGRVVAKLVSAGQADDQSWRTLRGQVVRYADPFAPAVDDDEIEAYK